MKAARSVHAPASEELAYIACMAKLKLLRNGPSDGPRLLLAHGAGAGMDSAFMNEVAAGLAKRGLAVARFEFPYMQRRRATGVNAPPDRAPVLLECFRQAVLQLGAAEELVIGGKSMGGRMASMLADELGVRGLVCLGYPFHPPGKPDKTRTEHLEGLKTRALIVQGTRDPFGTREDVASYSLSKRIRLSWIEDGDHDLTSRRSAGLTRAEAREQLLAAVAGFVEQLGRARGRHAGGGASAPAKRARRTS
jgi:predicted alpha/beta-hydrolase family hydrolase